jgi:hypothetical protein
VKNLDDVIKWLRSGVEWNSEASRDKMLSAVETIRGAQELIDAAAVFEFGSYHIARDMGSLDEWRLYDAALEEEGVMGPVGDGKPMSFSEAIAEARRVSKPL